MGYKIKNQTKLYSKEMLFLMIRSYNTGYRSGHYDTVTKQYVDVSTEKDHPDILILLYNKGYVAGNDDTVAGKYVNIVNTDMTTYHADVVKKIVSETTLYYTRKNNNKTGITFRAELKELGHNFV